MDIDKKHWISNGAEIVQTGDLVRLLGENGEWSEWGSADHLAGSRVDSFAQWHGMGIQFARVPMATAVKPLDRDEWITDPTEKIQPGDMFRVRDDQHSEYNAWLPADHLTGIEVGYFADWHRRDIQFCRPVRPVAQAASEPEWEPLPIEDTTMLQPGRDEARFRAGRGEWSAWVPLSGGPLSVTFFVAQRPSFYEYEFRRRRNWTPPAPEQPPAPTIDRGSKYHRTITQTLPGDTHGCSVTVDVYDVLQAFGVTCPATQHAVKKLLCPGLRGQKSAEQDISEAANSCHRAIQLRMFEL